MVLVGIGWAFVWVRWLVVLGCCVVCIGPSIHSGRVGGFDICIVVLSGAGSFVCARLCLLGVGVVLSFFCVIPTGGVLLQLLVYVACWCGVCWVLLPIGIELLCCVMCFGGSFGFWGWVGCSYVACSVAVCVGCSGMCVVWVRVLGIGCWGGVSFYCMQPC